VAESTYSVCALHRLEKSSQHRKSGDDKGEVLQGHLIEKHGSIVVAWRFKITALGAVRQRID